MARGRLSRETVKEILDLRFKKKKSVEDISVILDLSEARVQKEIDKVTSVNEDSEVKTKIEALKEDSDEFTDADWVIYWKDKYLEAHVTLLINGLV